MDQAKKSTQSYTNQQVTVLDSLTYGWLKVFPVNCPQNYDYNGIKLNVPAKGTKIKLDFKVIAGSNDFRKINVDNAGWRYGFLAVKRDGTRVYGKNYADANDFVNFTLPDQTQYLWLIVSRAPISFA